MQNNTISVSLVVGALKSSVPDLNACIHTKIQKQRVKKGKLYRRGLNVLTTNHANENLLLLKYYLIFIC